MGIGEIHVRKGIADKCQDLVADGMPKEKDAVWVAAGKTRAIDDISMTLDDGIQQPAIFGGVVFEVGVLDDDVIARGQLESAPDGYPFTLVILVMEIGDRGIGVVFDVFFYDEIGVVAGKIIDDDDLFLDGIGQFHVTNFVQQERYRRFFVVTRYQDGKLFYGLYDYGWFGKPRRFPRWCYFGHMVMFVLT